MPHERGEQCEWVAELVSGDRLGRVQVEPARERAKTGEELPLLFGEKIDAPVDRTSECLLTGRGVGLPSTSRSNRFSNRARMSATVSTSARAAASSMASGSPSSARQIPETSAALAAVNSKPGLTALARSQNNETAGDALISSTESSSGDATPSGGTGHAASPAIASGRLLVARTCMLAVRRRTALATAAAPASTCSQVSSTSRPFSAASAAAATSMGSSFGPVVAPMAAATEGARVRAGR